VRITLTHLVVDVSLCINYNHRVTHIWSLHTYSVYVCFSYSSTPSGNHRWGVYVGEHNISYHESFQHTNHILNVVTHPGFNVSSLENDLALVFLSSPVTFNDWTSPICLPPRNSAPAVGTVLWLMGWGRTIRKLIV
jgi:hypothetical protein